MRSEVHAETVPNGSGRDGLVILGERGDEHLGTHFLEAAASLEIDCHLLSSLRAMGHPLLLRVWWRLFRSLPFAGQYTRWVTEECKRLQPVLVLSLGRVPLRARGVDALRRQGAVTANFSSDDPWNPLYRSRWLLHSLAAQDWVFTPRQRNMDDLSNLGVRHVAYLPFGYSPKLHERQVPPEEPRDESPDVLYVGGCDKDRIPYLRALQAAGLSMKIYGGRWEQVEELRPCVAGVAGMQIIQDQVQSCKVTLVLPRHANRDGHVMRTFETAAGGGCMLVEDTPEHRALLESQPAGVMFFRGLDDMVRQAQQMVGDATLRHRLRINLHNHVVDCGRNRYQDRLASIWDQTVG